MIIRRKHLVTLFALIFLSGVIGFFLVSFIGKILISIMLLGLILIINSQVHWVPDGEAWMVKRPNGDIVMLKKGWHIILFPPKVDDLKKIISLKEIALPSEYTATTKDNVNLTLEVGVKVKVKDPMAVFKKMPKFEEKIPPMVRGEIRKIIKTMNADEVMRHRDDIGAKAKASLVDKVAQNDIELLGVALVKIVIPPEIEDFINKKAQAEYEMKTLKLKAKTELEVAKTKAEVEKIAIESTYNVIKNLIEQNDSLKDKNIPIEYIIGKNYLSTLQDVSKSNNSKVIVYPADIQKALSGLVGGVGNTITNSEDDTNIVDKVNKPDIKNENSE